MAAPIDIAYGALKGVLAAALVEAGFIAEAGKLVADPESGFEPSPDLLGVETWAAVFAGDVVTRRQILGGARSHYVIEMPVQLELAIAGPLPEGDAAEGHTEPEPYHRARLLAAIDAVAPLADEDPTLLDDEDAPRCERWTISVAKPVDIASNGQGRVVEMQLRLRAGDRLGRTAVTSEP